MSKSKGKQIKIRHKKLKTVKQINNKTTEIKVEQQKTKHKHIKKLKTVNLRKKQTSRH